MVKFRTGLRQSIFPPIGVLTHAPRFAAYNASKAALEAFSRCAAAEFAARGIRFH